jgi:hypothetical protein
VFKIPDFCSFASYFLMLRFDFRLYLNLEIRSSGIHLWATSSPCGVHLLVAFFHAAAMPARAATRRPPITTAPGINPPRSDSPAPSHRPCPHSPMALVPLHHTTPPPALLTGALSVRSSGATILQSPVELTPPLAQHAVPLYLFSTSSRCC